MTFSTDRLLTAQVFMGHVVLQVPDLPRSLAYYVDRLGFQLHIHQTDQAILGSEQPLLTLEEMPQASAATHPTTGLYHAAFLLPTRADLARFVRHLRTINEPFGYSDHSVSEALYLNDPDGNGLEIYRDRPRSEWAWSAGQVIMTNRPIDFANLDQELTEAECDWQGMPAQTTLGHMHLKVSDLQTAEHFYHTIMGFEITWRTQGALFLAAGKYHHHLGLNTWESLHAPTAPSDTPGLAAYTIVLPDDQSLAQLQQRLAVAPWPYTVTTTGIQLHDPWHHSINVLIG